MMMNTLKGRIVCALFFAFILGCDDSTPGPQGSAGDGGAESDAGQISGRYNPNEEPAVVSGTAQLGGAQNHGGILVEVVDGTASATSTSDGRFQMRSL